MTLPTSHTVVGQRTLPRQAPAPTRESGDAVVVGFDGSWHSKPAAERAAEEALQRGLPLRVLSMVSTDVDPRLSAQAQRIDEEERTTLARLVAQDTVDELLRRHPDLRVSVEVLTGPDGEALRTGLAGCRLLVVGDRGGHGARAFLLGTTSRDLVRAVACPVLVVPDDWTPDGPSGAVAQAVLVGVGPGPEAVTALRVAADEAHRSGAHLLVLHSYYGRRDGTPEERLAAARHLVEERLHEAGLDTAPAAGAATDSAAEDADGTAAHRTLHVTTVFTPDAPAEALLLHASRTRLLVIGSRGPIALARLSLDSVSRRVLDDAVAPVLLVPGGTNHP